MARKKYDFLIIGGGLTGLICAHSLIATGKKVALVDANPSLGGNLQFKDFDLGLLPAAFPKLPNSEQCFERVSRWANKTFFTETKLLKEPVRTKTFESGKLKDFVGFGKKAPDFVGLIFTLANNEKIELGESLSTAISRLSTQLVNSELCDIYTNSHLSNIVMEDDKVSLVEINTSKMLETENLLYTAPIKALGELEELIVDKKIIQAIAKNEYWTSIVLEMVHKSSEIDCDNDYVLRGGTDSAIPCYGYFTEPTNFQGAQEESFQISQWISFVEENLTNEMETTGNLVREMKRQVKRAFPEAMDAQVFEKISVYPSSHFEKPINQDLVARQKIDNLYLLGRELDQVPNAIGRIDSAVRFIDELDIPLKDSKEQDLENVEKAVDII